MGTMADQDKQTIIPLNCTVDTEGPMMITTIRITPAIGKRESVLELLRSIETIVRGQTGCLDCSVFEQSGNEKAILYLDKWRTSEELRLHIQSPLYLRLLLAMDLGVRDPEINFYTVEETKGYSLVEALRGMEQANR